MKESNVAYKNVAYKRAYERTTEQRLTFGLSAFCYGQYQGLEMIKIPTLNYE